MHVGIWTLPIFSAMSLIIQPIIGEQAPALKTPPNFQRDVGLRPLLSLYTGVTFEEKVVERYARP